MALSKEEPLTFFAGLWTSWTGELEHITFAFFTSEPNDVVGAIHLRACL